MASEDSYNESSSEEEISKPQSPPPPDRSVKTSSASEKVNQILKRLDGMGDFSPKAPREEAEKESNIGYRKGVREKMKPKKNNKGKGKAKVPAGRKSKRQAAIVISSDSEDLGKTFKVAAVMVVGPTEFR
ncbi:hypothetical protein QCA50_018046 [Cerrena zonata]|uniref:Uncharacterized protein n=1 Tax=Cerrena zonata TaxID=2478898 RepID=A0AAW0FE65_9APHY